MEPMCGNRLKYLKVVRSPQHFGVGNVVIAQSSIFKDGCAWERIELACHKGQHGINKKHTALHERPKAIGYNRAGPHVLGVWMCLDSRPSILLYMIVSKWT